MKRGKGQKGMPPPVRQQDVDATPEQVAAALLRRTPKPETILDREPQAIAADRP